MKRQEPWSETMSELRELLAHEIEAVSGGMTLTWIEPDTQPVGLPGWVDTQPHPGAPSSRPR
jgi:hypothetical protein